MNRKRSERLEPVVKLAGHREKTSAKLLGESRNAHSIKQNQLQDLQDYRTSYAKMLQDKAQQGMSSSEFCIYQDFLNQLDQAIEKQKLSLTQSTDTIKQNVKGWKNNHQKQKAMEKMTNQYKQQEIKSDDKKQQRDIDDETNQRRQNTEKLF